MQIVAAAFVAVVAALHVYFLVLEMFLWRTPFGRRTFGMTQEVADSSAVLASNQGLYNGFLAAGLIWGLLDYGSGAGRGGSSRSSWPASSSPGSTEPPPSVEESRWCRHCRPPSR